MTTRNDLLISPLLGWARILERVVFILVLLPERVWGFLVSELQGCRGEGGYAVGRCGHVMVHVVPNEVAEGVI